MRAAGRAGDDNAREVNCEACGRPIDAGAKVCPHCGARRRDEIPRVWVLAFFIMGIVIGLLLLNLQGVRYLPLGEDSKPAQVVVQERAETVKQSPEEKTDKFGDLEKTVEILKKSVTRAVEKLPGTAPAPEPKPTPTIEAVQCDRQDASEVWAKAEKLASIVEKSGRLQLHLKREWEYYGPGHRRGFIEAFSEAALCLKGSPHPISFIFRGNEVAAVSADGVIELK